MCFHYYLGVSVVRDKGKDLGVDEAIDGGILFSLAIIAANALMGVGWEYLGVRPMWGIMGASLVLVGLVGFLLPSERDVR